ncbi:hypothetical protein Q5P01_007562 [Channa striata]|uniref:Uncharacterized protein n=1 Tax=Channa striata TaxID=64152 RepID=A0AA88N8J4_CHASR|nr:hypothetical protein Q5P01_007562 [Channa striata]
MGRQAAQEDSHFRAASVAVNASRQRRTDTRPQGVTVEPQGHSDNSLPSSLTPLVPSGLLLLAWLAALYQAETPQALPPSPQPPAQHSLHHPLLCADRYSATPFI